MVSCIGVLFSVIRPRGVRPLSFRPHFRIYGDARSPREHYAAVFLFPSNAGIFFHTDPGADVQRVLEPDRVDDVVLVGGASRMPRLRALLQEFFGPTKRLHTGIDPDTAVAYGAANIID